jgi:hypothetical protein
MTHVRKILNQFALQHHLPDTNAVISAGDVQKYEREFGFNPNFAIGGFLMDNQHPRIVWFDEPKLMKESHSLFCTIDGKEIECIPFLMKDFSECLNYKDNLIIAKFYYNFKKDMVIMVV